MDPTFSSNQKKLFAERSWLLYYNRYLCDHGVISAEIRNRMTVMINARYSPADRQRGLAIS